MTPTVKSFLLRATLTGPIKWEPTELLWSMLVKKMLKQGFKSIGEGVFSHVFHSKDHPDRVWKVTRGHRNANAIRWLQWCSQHPSKYVPKIYSIHGFQDFSMKYAVIEMEKVEEPHPKGSQMVSWAKSKGLTDCFDIEATGKEFKFTADNVKQVKGDPALAAVIAEIVRLGSSDYYGFDMTRQNMFFRNNEMVFADPVSGGNF